MLIHNKYLSYALPHKWCSEENGDELFIYDPEGQGALVLSFFNFVTEPKSLSEELYMFSNSFVSQNDIILNAPFESLNQGEKTVLCGQGLTADQWFIRIWLVATWPKIILATYQSEQENEEIKICNSIIESFQIKII